ncbi:MAG TPA: hypothetical protein VK449_04935 [Anaerolineales bacterium]|nr:hypothetical protein [Anaerolineales bacterium]
MPPLDVFFLCALALLLPASIFVLGSLVLLRNNSQAAGLVLLTLGIFLGASTCAALFLWLQFRLPTTFPAG